MVLKMVMETIFPFGFLDCYIKQLIPVDLFDFTLVILRKNCIFVNLNLVKNDNKN